MMMVKVKKIPTMLIVLLGTPRYLGRPDGRPGVPKSTQNRPGQVSRNVSVPKSYPLGNHPKYTRLKKRVEIKKEEI